MSKLNTFNNLPPTAKGIIAVTGTGVLVYLLYLGKTYLDRKQIEKDSKETLDKISKEKSSDNSTQTYSASQYLTFSNALFTAMDGYGTGFSDIYSVFNSLKTKKDLLLLIEAFGIKEISSGRFNTEPNFTGNLVGCLHSELSASELSEINDLLKKKGISYIV